MRVRGADSPWHAVVPRLRDVERLEDRTPLRDLFVILEPHALTPLSFRPQRQKKILRPDAEFLRGPDPSRPFCHSPLNNCVQIGQVMRGFVIARLVNTSV